MRMRRVMFSLCLIGILFLWIPPVRSEPDSPPPPVFVKPAAAALVLLATAAVLLAPLTMRARIWLGLSLVLATVSVWILERHFWGGFWPF